MLTDRRRQNEEKQHRQDRGKQPGTVEAVKQIDGRNCYREVVLVQTASRAETQGEQRHL